MNMNGQAALLLLFYIFWTVKAGKQCSSPLGLQDGSIPDSALTASSARSCCPAHEARLNSSGGWVPDSRRMRYGQWLQVHFTNVTNITAIATQGHFQRNSWTESYSVYYSFDGTQFQPYHQQGLHGNTDNTSVVKHELDQPISARFVRIFPLINSSSRYQPALRLELYGCPADFSHVPGNVKDCADPLGMENKTIPDSAITASSSHSEFDVPERARLHTRKEEINGTWYCGGWAASYNDKLQWLQINLINTSNVTGIATQGENRYSAWVKSYALLYRLDDAEQFHKYRNGKILIGNADRDTVVRNNLEPPLIAKTVRINPEAWFNHIVMRVELYGCATDQPLVNPTSAQSTQSAAESKQLAYHTTAIPLESTTPPHNTRSDNERSSTRKAERVQETTQSFPTAFAYSTSQRFDPTNVQSSHSPTASKFVHHTTTVPLQSATPLLTVRSSIWKSTTIRKAVSAQETSEPQPMMTSRLASVVQTRTQLSDVIIMQSVSRDQSSAPRKSKTVEKSGISSSKHEWKSVTPTCSADKPLANFLETLKSADPGNKSSLQLVVNIMGNFTNNAAVQNGASALSASKEIEDFALKYAKNHLNNTNITLMTRHSEKLVLQIRKVSPNLKGTITVPQSNDTEDQKAFMKLPPGVFGKQSAYVVSIFYKNVTRLFGQGLDNSHSLGSNVIAVAVDDSAKLQKKVTLVFKDLENKKKSCVFWRPRAGGDTGGDWVDDGCSLSSISGGRHVQCSCDHMTHFAVLMQQDDESEPLPEIHDRVLTGFTYGGIGVSTLGNAWSIVTISFFLGLTKAKAQIRLGLVFCLFFGQSFFIMGIDATRYEMVCFSFAVVIEYFLLAAFTWMFLEGVQVYQRVTSVFKKKPNMLLYHAFAWGVPLCLTAVPVVIAMTADGGIHAYVNDKICWVRPGSVAYWTFIGFVSLITLMNCCVFGRALRVLIRRKRINNNTSPALDNLKKTARTCLVLFPLLGLTWIIGFVTLPLDHVVPKYLFVILNSVQGMLIYVFNTWKWDEINEYLMRERRLQEQIQHKRNEISNRRKAAANEVPERLEFNLSPEDFVGEDNDNSDTGSETGLPRSHIVDIETCIPHPRENVKEMEDPAKESEEEVEANAAASKIFTIENAAKPANRDEEIELSILKSHMINVCDGVEEITLTSPGVAPKEVRAQAPADELRVLKAKRASKKRRATTAPAKLAKKT